MYRNTKSYIMYGFFMATLFSTFFLYGKNAYASRGTDLAKEMFQKIQTASTKQEMDALLKKAIEEKSRLSTEERIDYAEYLQSVIASDPEPGGEGERSWNAVMLMVGGVSKQEMEAGKSVGISKQEIMAGQARMLASNDPKIRAAGENLDRARTIKLPNGEMGQDMSVFDLALHDPKVPRERLIKAMFKIAPVESAQWFTDHTGLSASEKAGLESDLKKAWRMHRALNDVNADKETKAVLDDSVKNPQLDRWLHSPSWILRSLANGLLQKHSHWQTEDLKKAMQPVHVPEKLQLSSTNSP